MGMPRDSVPRPRNSHHRADTISVQMIIRTIGLDNLFGLMHAGVQLERAVEIAPARGRGLSPRGE